MRDAFGRTIDYARISITDRCNLRCVYCMPEDGVQQLPHHGILSYEDIVRVAKALAQTGVRKLKITGGEPLVRRDTISLITRLKGLPGIDKVTLTTNGVLLGQYAQALKDAGLDSVNISLDSLQPARYREMTRTGTLDDVLAGIDAAADAGLNPIKINCVLMEGVNAGEAAAVAALARDRDIQVRFIELMPMGLGTNWKPLSQRRVEQVLTAAYGRLIPMDTALGNGPASYFAIDGFAGHIGFISAISGCFCQHCNRVRLTADGVLKGCLHMDEGISLAHALDQGNDLLLREQIQDAIWNKAAGHQFYRRTVEQRSMSQIGG